jgi:hypothetical protein
MTCGLLHSSLLFPTIACPRVCWGGGLIHYQAAAADSCQPPLRSGWQQRLSPSVAMTSEVKGWLPIVLPVLPPVSLRPSAALEPVRPDGCSGCSPWVGSHLPCLRRVPASLSACVSFYKPLNAIEGYTKPGLRLFRCTSETFCVRGAVALAPWAFGCYRHLFGNRPHKASKPTGNGHSDDIGVFAVCSQAPVAPTEPDLGLPADILDDFGLFFQARLQMPTDFGRIPVGPGAFDQSPSRLGVTALVIAPCRR